MKPDPLASPVSRAVSAGVDAYRGALAGAGGRTLQELRRDAVAAVLYASPPYDLDVPAMAVARVSICLTESVVEGGLAGDRPRRFEVPRHAVFFTPAGAPARWRKHRPSRHINLYLPQDAAPALPLMNAVLPRLRPLAEALAHELAGGDAFAAEAADSLARLVLVQLQRHGSRASLSPATLARLQDYVAANLERRLFVHELAALAGWPPQRFTQAFARQTGCTPHQWVMQQRMAAALALLRQGELPLAEVAARCGFASQQHMTTQLRRRLGRTPGRLRLSP